MLRSRAELHQLKQAKLGAFADHGRVFLYFKALAKDVLHLWDGPLGVGNLIPFVKPHTSGDKLHYETPMAGDRGIFARHHRRLIRVSSRSRFNFQILPEHVLPVRAAV
jgi:hypothetical protein